MHDYYITPEEYEIAERNGISADTLESRIRNSAWKKEVALTKKPQGHCKERKFYAKVAAENGIKESTFRMRISRGWSPKDAATRKKMTRQEISKLAHEKKGRKFTDEQLKVARSLGISNQRLYARTELLGWSKDEASRIPLIPNELSLKWAQEASPWREMDEIHWNMWRAKNGAKSTAGQRKHHQNAENATLSN